LMVPLVARNVLADLGRDDSHSHTTKSAADTHRDLI